MPQNIPYGNAYIVNTPQMDRLQAMMANDQRQKDLQEQRNAQLLDQEFAKNTSAMRDVDIPLLTKKWGEYKQKKQELYRNGNKMSNDERIQKQLDAQRALGEGYGIISKSKELKIPEEQIQKGYVGKPDSYDETTPDVLLQSRSLPIDQHPGIGTIVEATKLKTKDFTKNVAAAMGKSLKRANSTEVSQDKLTTTPTDYMAYNSPSQFAATLTESLPTARDKTAFVNQHSYSDLAASDILQKYSAIKETPAFKKAYPNEPEYNAEDLSDPFKKTIALTSMEHIIRNPPTAIVGKPYNNTGAVIDYNNENRKKAATLAYERALHKLGISIAAHRANTELLAKSGVIVKDPMKYLDEAEVVEIPQPKFDPKTTFGWVDGKPLHFVPFPSNMSEDNIRYIAGKVNESTRQRDIPTVRVDGKEGLYKDDDGNYRDKNNKIIDTDRGLINLIQDKATSLDKQNKGKVQVEGKSTQTAPKSKSGITWK